MPIAGTPLAILYGFVPTLISGFALLRNEITHTVAPKIFSESGKKGKENNESTKSVLRKIIVNEVDPEELAINPQTQ